MPDFDPTVVAAIRTLRQRFPSTPFLTLGQTVFWDEPAKAAFCRVMEEVAPDASIVAAVHDTDYFAKLPQLENREEDGEYYGLHDRASYLPAYNVRTEADWINDEGNEYYEIACCGTIRQTRVFGPNITLTRRVSTRLGENKLFVHDRIENEAFEPAPMVILYHCNFGFPVVSEHSTVRAPSVNCEPYNEFAAASADTWAQMEPPQPGIAERVYFHTMAPDIDGFVRAEIYNKELGFGAYLRYRFDELSGFTQWKMMGAGTYVCGLEPGNVPLAPRTVLRERGLLPYLQPGEVKEIRLELGVVES